MGDPAKAVEKFSEVSKEKEKLEFYR